MSTTAPTSSAPTIRSGDIDIYSNDIYVEGVPDDLLARLRHDAPIYLHPRAEADQPERRSGC